ncbi:hypothetical protein CYMTET_53526 [Cymbomonas tetramitiformis]|uniref:Uncharacterized protein n=1 Tax=Cymbomonas tetramitiformis TaxID=36881 RepID=A0AAE0BHY1_9CHLO|nr:hypothetical protein CYMTET_53526 [Cymbomonas tetramitiformis]
MQFPWKCPHCPKEVASAADMPDRAPRGDKARLEYQRAHKGVMHGLGPIIAIQPIDNIVDVLHFTLCEVHNTLENTCRSHCDTQVKADALAEYLKVHVHCFIKVRKPKTRQVVKEEKVPNVIGRECAATFFHFRGMLLIVLKETDSIFPYAVAVWTTLKALHVEI